MSWKFIWLLIVGDQIMFFVFGANKERPNESTHALQNDIGDKHFNSISESGCLPACQPACMKLSMRVYVFVHFVSPSRIHAAA